MKKILLVNNQEAFLERNKSLLDRAGFLILTASSAKQALQIHREQSVDLIICVLQMREMGGDALCSLIRRGGAVRNVPFILICYDNEAELERASKSGANTWLTKPVRPAQLLEQVGRFLTIPSRRDYRATFNAQVNGRRETVAFSGTTHNISASGILCETEISLNQDDLITNLLLAVDSYQIVTDGRVVRTERRPDGMLNYGVQFTSLAQESREKIEQFVASPGQKRPATRVAEASQSQAPQSAPSPAE